MIKLKWLILGLAVLLLATVVVINVSGNPTRSMSSECDEDGSCCEDEYTCSCG